MNLIFDNTPSTDTVRSSNRLSRLGQSFERTVPHDLERDRSSENCRQIGGEIKQYYFGFTEPSINTIDSYMKVNNILLIF